MTEQATVRVGHHLALTCLVELREEMEQALRTREGTPGRKAESVSEMLKAWLALYTKAMKDYGAAYVNLGNVAQQSKDGEEIALDKACKKIQRAGRRIIALHQSIHKTRFHWRYDQGRVLLGREIGAMLRNLISVINQYEQVVLHSEQFKPGQTVTVDLKLKTSPHFKEFQEWLASINDNATEMESNHEAGKTRTGSGLFTGLLLGALGFALFDEDCS